jgi:NAD(P)-dependent dehydrogenase (short-subunit alcohol dehydrogenase family)
MLVSGVKLKKLIMEKMKYYKSLFDLKNKITFVVGGSGLIGKEILLAHLSRGSKVVNFDIKKSNIKHQNLISKIIDLSDYKSSSETILELINQYGVPNIYINCSYPKTKDWAKNNFSSLTVKSYKMNIDIHLNSYVLISRLIAEKMTKKKQGSIILLGSIYGLVGQDLSIYKDTNMRENITYSIIKGGVINYTRQMASYYGPKNIRVNCLCPGGVLDKINVKNKNFIKNYKKKVPLGRLAKSREIAACCLFLSSEASTYVTGTTMVVDGGWTSI